MGLEEEKEEEEEEEEVACCLSAFLLWLFSNVMYMGMRRQNMIDSPNKKMRNQRTQSAPLLSSPLDDGGHSHQTSLHCSALQQEDPQLLIATTTC